MTGKLKKEVWAARFTKRPTLENLIFACGHRFVSLSAEWESNEKKNAFGITGFKARAVAEFLGQKYLVERDMKPEVAMAKIWLKLRKSQLVGKSDK